MSELPADRAERFRSRLRLSAESAQLLAFRGELGDYFEAALAAGAEGGSESGGAAPAPPPQMLANWLTSELVGRLGDGEEASGDPRASRVRPGALAALVGMVSAKRISGGAGRLVLDRLVAGGGDPVAIVAAEGLAALDGEEELAAIVAAALEANADAAERVRSGNAKAIGPIVGYVMRETKGRADGGEVTRLVNRQLGIEL
jgi:aspartyl-tRNA(Asn)/glutamyl-tRNA(Gln) amidotransferase subunit B